MANICTHCASSPIERIVDRSNGFLEPSKAEVSFVAKIDQLPQDNVRLAREVRKWERGAAMESKRGQAPELEASQLGDTIRQLHMKHISERKTAAEESKSKAVRYCREMSI